MCVGCACGVDCLHSLHGKGFELNEAGGEGRSGGDHVFEEVVDLAVGGDVVCLETDGKAGFG